MAPHKVRPSFTDCLKLGGAILRDTAGLAGQYVKIAAVETTAAAGRQLGRAEAALENARGAVGQRFDYTAPRPKGRTTLDSVPTPKPVAVPTDTYVKV
jgi:hypothetical protein